MNEIWKDIKGYEGKYQISNLGNVKSLLDKQLNKREIILKPSLNHKGYLRVYLSKDSKKTTKTIHRLVAETFVPNLESKKTVNHIDGNKINNRADNLEWLSNTENQKHAWELGLKKALKGEKNPMYGKKLSNETKFKISKALKGKITGENHPMYGRSGDKSPVAKKVICLNNKKIFECVKLGAKEVELNSLMDKVCALEEELSSLREYKVAKEAEELVAKVDTIAEKFTTLTKEEIEVVKTRVLNEGMTTEEFEKELYYLVGVKTLEVKSNYAATETVGDTVKMIPVVEEKEIIDEYGGLLKKHNLV